MRAQISAPNPSTTLARSGERPGVVETVLRWQEVGGIEGANLEWMLDRIRAPQEART